MDKLSKMIAYGRKQHWKYSMTGSRCGLDATADCSGFVWRCMKEAGIEVPKQIWNTATMYEDKATFMEIPIDQTRPGDLAFWGPRGWASVGANGHVGILTGNGKVLNCMYQYGAKTGVGVMEIPLSDFGRHNQPSWYARIIDSKAAKVTFPKVYQVSKIDEAKQLIYSAQLAGGNDYSGINAIDPIALTRTDKAGHRTKNQLLDVGDYFIITGIHPFLAEDKATNGVAILIGNEITWVSRRQIKFIK
jgi:hypothetical protein